MRRCARRACCLAAVVSVLAGGCATPRPVGPSASLRNVPSAPELEAALTARHSALGSLRALAHLRYQDQEQSSASREAIVVARPDRLRVEVLSVFGALYVVTADKGTLAAYARQENTVYRGPASPQNLSRYARVALPVNQLIDMVLATPHLHPGQPARVMYDEGVGAVRLSRDFDASQESVWLSDTAIPVAAEARNADGQLLWRATFSEFEDHGGLAVATRVSLTLAWSTSIDITLEDVDVNPVLNDALFALQTPPGSRVVNLDAVAD